MRTSPLKPTGRAVLGGLAKWMTALCAVVGAVALSAGTALAAKPTVASQGVSGVTPFAATLQAEVNPGNQLTKCKFEYGKTNAYGTSAPCEPETLEGESVQSASLALTGLEPARTYHYRVVASNAAGEAAGTDGEFTTVGRPLVTTGQATGLTRSSAVLTGTIDPERATTTYHFVYIDQHGYEAALALALAAADPYAEGASTAQREMQAGDEPQAIEASPATGLLPGTTYHYALVASNSAGTATGNDQTFTTGPATPPVVATGAASGITLSTATLSGTVNTQGLASSYAFEVSSNPGDYGSPTGAGSIDVGVEEATVTLRLQGLRPGTTYYYRALATSLDEIGYGAMQTFTTPGVANSLTPPASLPLIAIPVIVFPIETAIHVTPVTKKLTRARKLMAALMACKKKPKSKRASCKKRALKLYGTRSKQ